MIKGFWKISFSKLVPSFLKSDVKHPPKSKNFEIFPTSNSNNSKTKRSFEILKTPLNPACGDEQIVFFSFFLSPFPDLEKTVGSLNPVHFSRELLVKLIIICGKKGGEEGWEKFEGFATQKNLVHLPENRFWNPKSESRIIENDARIQKWFKKTLQLNYYASINWSYGFKNKLQNL